MHFKDSSNLLRTKGVQSSENCEMKKLIASEGEVRVRREKIRQERQLLSSQKGTDLSWSHRTY